MTKERALILKFGGSSATNMEGANTEYLSSFLGGILDLLQAYDRVGVIIGGGPRIRELQKTVETNTEKDLIAREALWEHAEQLRKVAEDLGLETFPNIPHSPAEVHLALQEQMEKVIAVSWLNEGQSTDASAVFLAEEWKDQGYEAVIVILSNVLHIFTADPKSNPDAAPIQSSSVSLLVKEGVLLNDPEKFRPGMNVTIDPVAVSHLEKQGKKAPAVFFGDSQDITGVRQFLSGENPETGTVLRPDIRQTSYVQK